MKGELEVLIAARELISDPNHWCQGTYDRHSYGFAPRFCARGAINYVLYGDANEYANEYANECGYYGCEYSDRLVSVSALSAGRNLTHFNDKHQHDEVIALFDKRIAQLSPDLSLPGKADREIKVSPNEDERPLTDPGRKIHEPAELPVEAPREPVPA